MFATNGPEDIKIPKAQANIDEYVWGFNSATHFARHLQRHAKRLNTELPLLWHQISDDHLL